MTSIKSRLIPGVTLEGVTRGGGSETIEWARNGPLLLQRSCTYVTPGKSVSSYLAGRYVYAPAAALPSGSADSDSTVRSNGSTAAARSNPTSPSVNLLTSAGELAADGLPNPTDFFRWKSSVRDILRLAGGQYLAVQFAWLPLLGEIQAYCRQVMESDRIIRAAKELHAKREIRVGYSFPEDQVNTDTFPSTVNPAIWTSGTLTGNLAKGGRRTSISKKTWFEAEYLNLLPIRPDQYDASKDFAQKARYILGLHLTPETLWELAPWSWAVDYFTNMGDVLTQVSNTLSDGLVMRNGFVMHHTRRTSEVNATTFHMAGGFVEPKRFTPCRTVVLSETKKRFVSVPYFGFGSPGQLSAKQVSILAALGISRVV